MGVIAKQTIIGSIYTYAGAFLGFAAVGVLMPKFFSTEEVGLLNLIVSVSLIFANFSSLGFIGVINRLFPYFRSHEDKHRGILILGIIFTGVGFIISIIIFYLLKDYLIESNKEKSSLFSDNIYYLIPYIFINCFFALIDNYTKALYDATSGIFLKEFLLRVLNLIIIIVYAYGLIDFDEFLFYYLIVYATPVIFQSLLLVKRKSFFLSGLDRKLLKELLKEILNISGYYLISGFSAIAILSIDKYMVNHYLGLSETGIYSIAFYFGSMISLPSRALRKISTTVIAEAMKKNDYKQIYIIYEKSTISQFIIALYLFGCLFLNIGNILKILPDYASGEYVIIFIGISFVIEMLFGVNQVILANSEYYKTQAVMMIISLVVIIGTNAMFIPVSGITGAAYSAVASMIISSLMRYVFLYMKFKLNPFSLKHIKILLISIFSFGIVFYIPEINNLYIDITVKIGVLSIIFMPAIFFSKVSDDINMLIYKVLNYLKLVKKLILLKIK